MRKILTIAALVAVAATACNKLSDDAVKNSPVKGEETQMTFRINGANLTKATEAGNANENTVNKVDILVFFNGGSYDGQLDAYKNFTGASILTGTVKATTGARTIYAVVNSEFDLSTVETIAQLRAKVATLASQKTAGSPDVLDNFTMIGSTDQTLVAGDNAVGINVDRIAARVRVKKITRNFESPALAAQSFVINEMYISNSVTNDEYDLGYTPVVADFVSQQGVPTAAYDLWLRRAIPSAESFNTLAQGASANIAGRADKESFNMYTFPNTNGIVDPDPNNGTKAEFAVQNTKLVVKATLVDKVMYYVIPLPALQANYTYDIEELVITRPGSSDPNQKTEVANVNYTITINPWTIAPIETETGKYVI